MPMRTVARGGVWTLLVSAEKIRKDAARIETVARVRVLHTGVLKITMFSYVYI